MTMRHRARAGSRIIRLNPFNVLGLGSDGFNPIAVLELTKLFPDDAMQLAEAVIRMEGKDPHWSQAAQDLVAALIMYVRLVIPNGSFADVRRLLGRDENGWRLLVRGGLDLDPIKYAKWLNTPPKKRDRRYLPPVEHNGKLYPGMIAAATKHGWPQIETKIASFGNMAPENRELHSVLRTAQTQTRWLDSPSVQEDLSKNSFDWRSIRERPTTVYLMLPADRMAGQHSAWMRLMVASIVQKLMKDTRPPKVPILLMLDEYYALAEGDGFPIVSRNLPIFRGFGIKLWTVWQDLNQAKHLYGDSYETFVNNAGIVQAFAPQDLFSSNFLSQLTGQTTRRVRTVSQSSSLNPGAPRGVNISRTAGINLIPRALILPHEIRNMPPGHSLIFSDQIRDGTVIRSYVQWPGDVPSLRHIMRLDPGRSAV